MLIGWLGNQWFMDFNSFYQIELYLGGRVLDCLYFRLGIGNWALGIGHWALGMGHWAWREFQTPNS
ncbi:hypothetical protein A4S05_25430 [Nostoc sp. KVJ20]|nr:hypothetical protein A4S05_25430 [Nostoc sp. KVJ20]